MPGSTRTAQRLRLESNAGGRGDCPHHELSGHSAGNSEQLTDTPGESEADEDAKRNTQRNANWNIAKDNAQSAANPRAKRETSTDHLLIRPRWRGSHCTLRDFAGGGEEQRVSSGMMGQPTGSRVEPNHEAASPGMNCQAGRYACSGRI